MDLALNNLHRLICHKNQPTKPNHVLYYFKVMQYEQNDLFPFKYMNGCPE